MSGILIFRTSSEKLLDVFINHPTIRPTVSAEAGPLSSRDVVSDRRNICLCGTGGGAAFRFVEPGVYEGHIFLMPDHRGAEGLRFGKAALTAMFGLYEASRIVAAVPNALPAARCYVRRLGFISQGVGDTLEHFALEKSR